MRRSVLLMQNFRFKKYFFQKWNNKKIISAYNWTRCTFIYICNHSRSSECWFCPFFFSLHKSSFNLKPCMSIYRSLYPLSIYNFDWFLHLYFDGISQNRNHCPKSRNHCRLKTGLHYQNLNQYSGKSTMLTLVFHCQLLTWPWCPFYKTKNGKYCARSGRA